MMLGNLGKMMKLAVEVKSKLPEIQAKMEAAEYTASAGGGAVTATVNGKGAITGVKISPEAVADGDAAMLEDLVKAAVSAAQDKAAQAAAAEMQAFAEEMGVPPGLQDMLS